MRSRNLVLAVSFAAAAAAAQAQTLDRVSLDAAISVTQSAGPVAGDRPDVIVDVTGAMQFGGGWVGYVRPWFRKASTSPYDFAKTLYQAAVQHEHRGRISTRFDAGYILSPIGIGMMDMRPDTNPVTTGHLSYFVPMPSFDAGAPASLPIASSYPLGAVMTVSARRWDLRGGVMASPPNRGYLVGAATPNPPARPFAVVGGGVTPRTGLRLGAAFAQGNYAVQREINQGPANNRQLSMMSLEGELAFGYTKITGEVTHDRIETARGQATATQWFIQGAQTISPRWYLGVRHEGANAPSTAFLAAPRLRLSEVAVSYRLSPQLILRNGFSMRQTYFNQQSEPQYSVAFIWAARLR